MGSPAVGRWVGDAVRWGGAVVGVGAGCAVGHLLLVVGLGATLSVMVGGGSGFGGPVDLLGGVLVYGSLFGAGVGVLVGGLTAPVMATPSLAGDPRWRAGVVWVPAALWVVVTVVLAWPVGTDPGELAAMAATWFLGPAVWIHLALRRLVARWEPGRRRPPRTPGADGPVRTWEYGR